MGGMGHEAHDFLKTCKHRNLSVAEHMISVLVTQHSKWVATRLRRAVYGQSFFPPEFSTPTDGGRVNNEGEGGGGTELTQSVSISTTQMITEPTQVETQTETEATQIVNSQTLLGTEPAQLVTQDAMKPAQSVTPDTPASTQVVTQVTTDQQSEVSQEPEPNSVSTTTKTRVAKRNVKVVAKAFKGKTINKNKTSRAPKATPPPPKSRKRDHPVFKNSVSPKKGSAAATKRTRTLSAKGSSSSATSKHGKYSGKSDNRNCA